MDTKEKSTRVQKSLMFRTVVFVAVLILLLPQTASATEYTSIKSSVVSAPSQTVVLQATRNDNELPPMPLPGQQKKLRGDADGNGLVNYMDALLVLRHSIGLEHLSDATITLCDVDGKKNLSYMDALMILRYSIGLISKL